MTEVQLQTSRSQYLMIDESIQISSVSSRNRNGKYFVRRPINGTNNVGKKKDREAGEFLGFYSPVQKQEMMMKKSLIEKAIGKSPEGRIFNMQKKTKPADTIQTEKNETLNLIQPKNNNSSSNLENTFKKKKLAHDQTFTAREVNKNKQNPEIHTQEYELLKLQNQRLKREILLLTENQKKNEQIVCQFDLLKEYIKQIQMKLQTTQNENNILTTELQDIRSTNSSIDALETIHLQTIKSLNELNFSLKKEVVQLQEKMKYAGIEILMLKMKCPDEAMSKIIEERINLKQKNRQLRAQITKLKARVFEAELFELTPENTARDHR